MTSNTAFLLTVLLIAVTLYIFFFVVTAGVEAGVRRALQDKLLRTAEVEQPVYGEGRMPFSGPL